MFGLNENIKWLKLKCLIGIHNYDFYILKNNSPKDSFFTCSNRRCGKIRGTNKYLVAPYFYNEDKHKWNQEKTELL